MTGRRERVLPEATHDTVDELAAKRKVHPATIRREIRRGKLVVDRYGRAIRIPIEQPLPPAKRPVKRGRPTQL
jgi:hypothetical protein